MNNLGKITSLALTASLLLAGGCKHDDLFVAGGGPGATNGNSSSATASKSEDGPTTKKVSKVGKLANDLTGPVTHVAGDVVLLTGGTLHKVGHKLDGKLVLIGHSVKLLGVKAKHIGKSLKEEGLGGLLVVGVVIDKATGTIDHLLLKKGKHLPPVHGIFDKLDPAVDKLISLKHYKRAGRNDNGDPLIVINLAGEKPVLKRGVVELDLGRKNLIVLGEHGLLHKTQRRWEKSVVVVNLVDKKPLLHRKLLSVDLDRFPHVLAGVKGKAHHLVGGIKHGHLIGGFKGKVGHLTGGLDPHGLLGGIKGKVHHLGGGLSEIGGGELLGLNLLSGGHASGSMSAGSGGADAGGSVGLFNTVDAVVNGL